MCYLTKTILLCKAIVCTNGNIVCIITYIKISYANFWCNIFPFHNTKSPY